MVRPNSEPAKRRGKDREDGEFHAEKRAHHGHELHVSKAHAFGSTPAQVDCARAINERRAQGRAKQGIEQGKQASGDVGTEGKTDNAGQKLRGDVVHRNQQAEEETESQAGERQLVGQELGFGVGEDEAQQKKSEDAVFQRR